VLVVFIREIATDEVEIWVAFEEGEDERTNTSGAFSCQECKFFAAGWAHT
jgi:hypothetical protein